MPVITVNGPIGSVGAVATRTAEVLGLDYVDRLILAEAGKRVGVPVAALAEKEERLPSFRDRVAKMLQRALERSAVAGSGGDPFFGTGVDSLLVRPYPEVSETPTLDDQRYLQVISEVVKDLAKAGNVVIVGRASNIILRDLPGAFHVGTVAPLKYRVKVIIEREHMEAAAAERYVLNAERARLAFVKHHFKVSAEDPLTYHAIFNVARADKEVIARTIAQMASALEKGA